MSLVWSVGWGGIGTWQGDPGWGANETFQVSELRYGWGNRLGGRVESEWRDR